jgi:hypothetical protein
MLVFAAPKTLENQDAGILPFTDGRSAHATVQSPFRSRFSSGTNKSNRSGAGSSASNLALELYSLQFKIICNYIVKKH